MRIFPPMHPKALSCSSAPEADEHGLLESLAGGISVGLSL